MQEVKNASQQTDRITLKIIKQEDRDLIARENLKKRLQQPAVETRFDIATVPEPRVFREPVPLVLDGGFKGTGFGDVGPVPKVVRIRALANR